MLQTRTVDSVLVVTIDRPERRNALDRATVADLTDLLATATVESAPPVVVTGGGTVFSSGFDLSTFDEGAAFKVAADAMFGAVLAYPAPVIAAMNGPAVGMGAVLAATCDIRIGAPGAWLEIPAARLGVVLGEDYVARVRDRLGIAAAQLLFVASRRVEAARAHELGAIHALAEDPLAEAIAWGSHAASLTATSLAAHKAIINGLAP